MPNKPAIIDTHCHYNLEPLYSANGDQPETWKKHWQQAQDHGVQASLVVGTTLETSLTAVSLAQQEPNLWATVGIHPTEFSHFQDKPDTSQLEELIKADQAKTGPNQVKAIGEAGLDYYRLDKTSRDFQRQLNAQEDGLVDHILLANTYQLPLILHVRDTETPDQPTDTNAYWDTLSLIEAHHAGSSPIVLHCVSGPLAYIEAFLAKGAYVSVAANITYPKADEIRAIVEMVPADKLLVETDAPFLPPQEFRGQLCEPWMIRHTAEYLSNHFSNQTTANAQDLFGLK